MKEAFWGVLIVLLGLFGIVVVNIFQNVTVDNDRVYYLIKESTAAAAFDAVDLTYYRLSGKLRIVEDKFVENLTRRFAENVTIGDYRIVVEDINEMPPKISLRVRSGVTSIKGESFGIVNRVDGILETKYSLDEVLDFLGITKEEWDRAEETKIEKDENTGENVCKVATSNTDEIECIPGDIKFVGFENADVVEAVCQDETPSSKEEKAKYKVCDCGKWIEESETLSASPVKVGNEWVYTWTFNKAGEIRTINETIKSRVNIQMCTTGVEEMVPKDIDTTNSKEDGKTYEPSTDNSSYVTCPAGGIKIPVGMKFVMHPNYIPKESINRDLVWSSTDDSIVGVTGSNPVSTCILNNEGTNCFAKAIVTAKKVGTAYVNIKTTRNQTASCKVEVYDGNVDSVSCENKTMDYNTSSVMKRDYSPKNAIYTDFKWSIDNSSIATIDEKTGAVVAKSSGSTTVTITAPNGKKGTCTLTVKDKPSSGGGGDSGDSGGGGGAPSVGGGGCSCPYYEYSKTSVCTTTYIILEEYCGKTREPYSCNCQTKKVYTGGGKYVYYQSCSTCYRLEPKYCEVKKPVTTCKDVTKYIEKWAGGSIRSGTSTYISNGRTCYRWYSYCETSRTNCNYRSGSSC